jgi:hypothetical protein
VPSKIKCRDMNKTLDGICLGLGIMMVKNDLGMNGMLKYEIQLCQTKKYGLRVLVIAIRNMLIYINDLTKDRELS